MILKSTYGINLTKPQKISEKDSSNIVFRTFENEI
jgi:hypothetical protein